MIINHARNRVELHSRIECYANPTRPTIEINVIRNGLALEPTIELDYEQAQAFMETLARLLVRADEHAGTLDTTQMHERAETLLEDANTTKQVASSPWVKSLKVSE